MQWLPAAATGDGLVACLFEAGEESPYETIRISLINPGSFTFSHASGSGTAGGTAKGKVGLLKDGHDGMAGAWG
jgi:hypothetical protein